jgi:hypothetical protein
MSKSISKELKKAKFNWDGKTLIIEDEFGGLVKLNKIYGFSLTRFFLRVCQKSFLKQFSRKELEEAGALEESSEDGEKTENPNQMLLFEINE